MFYEGIKVDEFLVLFYVELVNIVVKLGKIVEVEEVF